MKFVLIASSLFSLNLMAQAPRMIETPIDHLFIPQGFDNNDNVELVVTGKFPNPCFTRNKVDVKVKGDKVSVRVMSTHKDRGGELCESLNVPFTEVITIGTLQGGDYEVNVNGKLNEKLSVAESDSHSVDDHLYALGEYVNLGFTGGLSGDAFLIGKSISSCLELDHVEYISNGKDTYSVLPIMKKVSTNCPEEVRRIEIPLKFDLNALKGDKILLFVRSVDGKSIHSIIDKD